MLPFVNCLVLYILMEDGQIFNKYYVRFMENTVPRLPSWFGKMLACVLCTSFWMGFAELLIMGELSIFTLAYNAVFTTILYKFLR